MAIPRSYLLVAPEGAGDLLGRSLNSTDIIKKLRKINPRIVTNAPAWAAPVGGTQQLGITCLWLGEPHTGEKITSIRLGEIPEFTQLSPQGVTICKGWRAIFEKVIKSGAATKFQLEKAFGVSLEISGDDGLCRACMATNKRRKHNGGVNKACGFHEKAKNVQTALERGKDTNVHY